MYTQVINRVSRLRVRANLIALAHFLWLILVLISLPLMLIFPWYKFVAVATILLTVGSWAIYGDCPLYILENRLRGEYDNKETYSGSFSAHYLHKLFSLDVPSSFFTAFGYGYALLIILIAILRKGVNN